MALPPLATTTRPCPDCNGKGHRNEVRTKDGDPVIVAVKCSTCGGDGKIAGSPIAPPPLEIWPFVVPLVIFLLFFLYLQL